MWMRNDLHYFLLRTLLPYSIKLASSTPWYVGWIILLGVTLTSDPEGDELLDWLGTLSA